MSQQRYNQRHPLAPPSPALISSNNRAELNPIVVPVQAGGGRIFPDNQDVVQINILPKPNEPIIDAKFEQACNGFFKITIRLQVIAFLFFIALMLATQVGDNFTAAIAFYMVLTCVYTLIRLVMICIGNMEGYTRVFMFFKFVESLMLVLFFGTLLSGDDSVPVAFFVILLISYLLRMRYSYNINQFEHSKFGNYITRIVLLLRVLIFIQLVLILVKVRYKKQMTCFAVVIPAWIIFVVISVFTITLFRRVYFVYEDQLWENNGKKMTKVSRWIFGNLFILACLVPVISILVGLVYDGHISESSNAFLVPFIFIVVWCPFSLFWSYRMRAEIPKVMHKIGDTLDSKKVEKKEKEDHEIKYVIKMSNTYFKPAQKNEAKQYKKWKKSIFKCWKRRPEAQAGLKRMPTESGRCVICYINVSDGVFMKCGHGGICFECGEHILKTQKGCHLCREKVKSLLNIKMNTKNMNAIYYKVKKEIHA